MNRVTVFKGIDSTFQITFTGFHSDSICMRSDWKPMPETPPHTRSLSGSRAYEIRFRVCQFSGENSIIGMSAAAAVEFVSKPF